SAATRPSSLRGRAPWIRHRRLLCSAGRSPVDGGARILCGRESGGLDPLGPASGLVEPAASSPGLRHPPSLLRAGVPHRPGEILRAMAPAGRAPTEPRNGRGHARVNPWLETIYHRSPIPVQTLYISWYGSRILRQRFNPHYDRWMALFERSQWWGSEDLGTYQDEALAALVAHCYDTVPFYRRVMEERGLRPGDVTTRSELSRLPIVTKDTIRRDPAAFLARGVKPGTLKESPTSGTTGASFTVLWDREPDILWNALLWRHG